MKKFSCFIGCLLALSLNAPVFAEESSQGKELVKKLEEAYQQGEYDTFLKALDREFKKAGKAGLLGGVLKQMKQGTLIPILDQTDKEIQERVKNWRELEKNLIQERNRKLMEVCETAPDEAVCKIANSVVFFSPDSEEEGVFQQLEKFKFKVPGENQSPLEQKISAIELEYEMKAALLDIAALNSKNALVNLENKKVILAYEKMQKIELSVKNANDDKWAAIVKNAKQSFEKYYGHMLDMAYLKNLAKGKIESRSEAETKIKEIMVDFLAARKELAEKHLSKK